MKKTQLGKYCLRRICIIQMIFQMRCNPLNASKLSPSYTTLELREFLVLTVHMLNFLQQLSKVK